ncbi:MAG: hypothetical protein V8R26_04160 [Clostridia bacterium]
MIKVFKIETILKTLILLTAIVVSILVIKNKVKMQKLLQRHLIINKNIKY